VDHDVVAAFDGTDRKYLSAILELLG